MAFNPTDLPDSIWKEWLFFLPLNTFQYENSIWIYRHSCLNKLGVYVHVCSKTVFAFVILSCFFASQVRGDCTN